MRVSYSGFGAPGRPRRAVGFRPKLGIMLKDGGKTGSVKGSAVLVVVSFTFNNSSCMGDSTIVRLKGRRVFFAFHFSGRSCEFSQSAAGPSIVHRRPSGCVFGRVHLARCAR